jgi:acyl-CoA reductase-like NAD-dependent aldehyde dehydrogenase
MEYFLLVTSTQNSRDIALDITSMVGKPLQQSSDEIKAIQEIANSLIEVAPKALRTVVLKDTPKLYQAYEKHPVGVVMQMTPWNNPLKSTMPHLLTSVLAGNAVVMLNSPYTPLVGEHIEKAFREAGVPDLVRCFHVNINDTKNLLNDFRIGYVNFTGGNEGGQAVSMQVAQRLFIDVGLYLSCSNACYVAEDCDLETHLAGIINGCLDNSGQQSTNIERVFVHKNKYQEFLDRAEEEISKYAIGDPQSDDTLIGPLCLPESPTAMQAIVEDAVSEGAQLICGGRATNDEAGYGRFFEPTLICDLKDTMQLFVSAK